MNGPREFALDTEVIVVGFGGSGAAAAIEAHDQGAKVLILEKASPEAHAPTTALLAGGAMFTTDEAEAHTYLAACAGKLIPPEVSRAWAREATTLRNWLNQLDPERFRMSSNKPGAEFPHLPGAAAIESAAGEFHVGEAQWAKAAGAHMFAALRHAVANRGIEVRYGTRAQRLLSEAGRIVGVVADADGTTVRVVARKAVILATGGFEFDDELKRQYLTGGDSVHFYGSKFATGDGVRMAAAEGADLWHMSSMAGRGVGHFEGPDGQVVNAIMLLDLKWVGRDDEYAYVITDGHGRRFADESIQAALGHSFYYEMLHYDAETGSFPRIPSYWFFDHRRFTAGALTIPRYGAAGVGTYQWSDDNLAELERGWIHRADTIEELAAAVGITDPAATAAEIADYNQSCVDGDDRFRARGASMVAIEAPPYYCVKLWPGGTNTTGGPRRDANGQIVHVFGHSIEGLYGCGENGSIIGERYPGLYAYYSEVLSSGRIAGRNAARLHPQLVTRR
ncbi:FAD-dependent oxidoreductase [Mycolicibacterium farcinogenes]|uniref:FAD-dependent oxidoreductase n=1 Tax=Mycolicibacterium farcinogenes TaxID=1802 RepID=UPI001C8DA302|nr:FAD-dependent oxidoreductase [Mycolicibacterium farcinogenes]QZH60910.1 FAD-dependent oxidoreductase [Mycolicibacterium farcinogenes]